MANLNLKGYTFFIHTVDQSEKFTFCGRLVSTLRKKVFSVTLKQ
jgi:hypothetical protein